MKKKHLIYAITSSVLMIAAISIMTVDIRAGNIFGKRADYNDYEIVCNHMNAPEESRGKTSANPSGSFTYDVKGTNTPFTYNKVYESSTGHVSLAIGGSIMSSLNSGSNISDINNITISYSNSSQNVYLRYGFKGEDHQLIVTSGTTYEIYGNWFQIRNCDLSVIENLEFTVSYPCSIDVNLPTDAFFEEGFNNGGFDKHNLAFDELSTVKIIEKSYDTTNGYINLNLSTSEVVRYLSFMSTISRFDGEYAVSLRIKLNDANNRFMILLGKSDYKTSYNKIVNNSKLGTSIEFNYSGKWVRVSGGSGQKIANGVLTANPTEDFVTYTIRRNYVAGSLDLYQNDSLVYTFTDSTYVCDGFISFIAGSAGNAGYVIDGFAVEGPTSNDFDYHFEAGTIGKNLSYHSRGAAGNATVAKSNLIIPFSNGNLSTIAEIKNIEMTVKYKNPSDGRLTVVFGATLPNDKGYRAGSNIGAGLVGVMITPTFARVFNESSGSALDKNYTFGTADSYIEFSLSLKEGILSLDSGSTHVFTTTVANVSAGYLCITAGNSSPATVYFDRIAIKGQTDTGLLPQKCDLHINGYQSVDVEINQIIGVDNYMTLVSENSKHFAGQFVYQSLEDRTKEVAEDFYVEPNNKPTEFRQFLDAYRVEINSGTGQEMSVGNFGKYLVKLVIKNLESTAIDVKLDYLSAGNINVPANEKMLYLEKDNLKVGVDLATGGTLSYLEKTSHNGQSVDLITQKQSTIDFNPTIKVGPNYGSLDRATKRSSHVNLINIYDTGRQIQQSYYASVGGVNGTEEQRRASDGNANGYTRRKSYTASSDGYYWPYNPVQGGDEINNVSQIIDFHVTSDEIYCKTRALDWAAGTKNVDRTGNRVTKSYMETWCNIENGVLIVKNRFIDWNGFSIDSSVPTHNLELPATYIAHPLHNYYAYIGDKPFDDQEMSTKANLDIQGALPSWKNGSYKTNKHLENWFAWLNDDADPFGVAVYIPGTNYYASGRSSTSLKVNEGVNKNANDSPMVKKMLYNKTKPSCDYDPCYTSNTSYTAPTLNVRMKEYVALSYEYAIAVDNLSNFRQIFKQYYQSGKCANTGLTAWN